MKSRSAIAVSGAWMRGVIGHLLAAALLWWVGRSAVHEWRAASSAWPLAVDWGALSAAGGAVAVALCLAVAAWQAILKWLGRVVSFQRCFGIVGISSLGRYLPGKVWTIAGKVGLLQGLGIPWRVGMASLGWEVAIAGLAAALWWLPGSAPASPLLRGLWYGGRVALLVLVGGLGWRAFRAGRADMMRLAIAVGQYALMWLLMGVGFFWIGRSLIPLSMGDLLGVIRAYALAHMVSVVVIWVPNGIGVREWCLHLLLAGTPLQPVAGVAAMLMRMIVTGCELAYAAAGWWVWSRSGRSSMSTVGVQLSAP